MRANRFTIQFMQLPAPTSPHLPMTYFRLAALHIEAIVAHQPRSAETDAEISQLLRVIFPKSWSRRAEILLPRYR